MFFAFPPPRPSIKNLHRMYHIILYYHVTKQCLHCLIWLITCFQFQNMFRKNISCFRFWWKTCTKCCTNNYVISRVKRVSQPAFCGWSRVSISKYDLENRRIPCQQKYWIENMAVKIPIFDFVLLMFTLLTFSCLYCNCKLF